MKRRLFNFFLKFARKRVLFLKWKKYYKLIQMIHLKCTVVHHANLNKLFLNYGPLDMLLRFFDFLLF